MFKFFGFRKVKSLIVLEAGLCCHSLNLEEVVQELKQTINRSVAGSASTY